jgi:hypothetical protein
MTQQLTVQQQLDQALAIIKNQEAEKQALVAKIQAQPVRKLSMKVSEKGGLSVYGMGRFPITLYKEQWTKLLAIAPEIQAFIKANDSLLKAKE